MKDETQKIPVISSMSAASNTDSTKRKQTPAGNEWTQFHIKNKRTLKIKGWLLFLGGLAASSIAGNKSFGSTEVEVFVSVVLTGCWIAGIVCFIKAARIKVE